MRTLRLPGATRKAKAGTATQEALASAIASLELWGVGPAFASGGTLNTKILSDSHFYVQPGYYGAGVGASVAVTYPKPFPKETICVIAWSDDPSIAYTSSTASGFVAGFAAGGAKKIHYIAVGR